MSRSTENQKSSFSVRDKWNQLKTETETFNFPLMIYYPSTHKKTFYDSAKIRNNRITWSSGDNACLNFFSSTEIRAKFISVLESIDQENKPFRDVYWEYSDRPFRLALKNTVKEKVNILYLENWNQASKVVFYFKYKLQLKKKMDYYGTRLDLATVWKARHYFQPLLERMAAFAEKYRGVPRMQLLREKQQVRQVMEQGKVQTIVEEKVNVNLIKETVADNNRQITFQIFDFQIVGVVVIDGGLIKGNEVGPLRTLAKEGVKGDGKNMDKGVIENQKTLPFPRKNAKANDFKNKFTRKQTLRGLEAKKTQKKREKFSDLNYSKSTNELRNKIANKLNSFESEQEIAEPENNADEAAKPKSPKFFGDIIDLKPSGTVRNISRKRMKEFKAGTGDQLGFQEEQNHTTGEAYETVKKAKDKTARATKGKTRSQRKIKASVNQPIRPPEDEEDVEIMGDLSDIRNKAQSNSDLGKINDMSLREPPAEVNIATPVKPKTVRTKIFEDSDEDQYEELDVGPKSANTVKSTMVDKLSSRKPRKNQLFTFNSQHARAKSETKSVISRGKSVTDFLGDKSKIEAKQRQLQKQARSLNDQVALEDEDESEEDDDMQETRLIKVELRIPENGIGGGPRFLVQYDRDNYLFTEDDNKINSNLFNTLTEVLRIDHALGKDFKYYHVESLVKAFLPLQLVSPEQIQLKNQKKLKEQKKRYEKFQEKKALRPIREEGRPRGARKVSSQNIPDFYDTNNQLNRSSQNNSLRTSHPFAESVSTERRQKAYRNMKNDILMLGYKGGNKQLIKNNQNQPSIKEFTLNLVELKRRFKEEDSLVVDSNGNHAGQRQFGLCGVFVVLKKVSQPLQYVTLDIQAESKSSNKALPAPSFSTNMKIYENDFKKNSTVQFTPPPVHLAGNMITTSSGTKQDLYEIYNQSQLTTVSKQLDNVNTRHELFGMEDVLQEWTGAVFTRLQENDALFAKSLLNLPLGNQGSKDHGVVSLVKSIVAVKEMFVAWDSEGPFEFAQLPNVLINRIFKKDMDHLVVFLSKAVLVLEKVAARLAKKQNTSAKPSDKKFSNVFDHWKSLFDFVRGAQQQGVDLTKAEVKSLHSTKNFFDKNSPKLLRSPYAQMPDLGESPSPVDEIYFSETPPLSSPSPNKKVKINRVSQIEAEYFLFKNKSQREQMAAQITRIVSKIWQCPREIAHVRNLCLSLLDFFDRGVSNKFLYFFMLGNILLGSLGSNWAGLASPHLRQALFSLSFNFFGQELDDNLVLNLLHLLTITLVKGLFDPAKGGKDITPDLKLVRMVQEFETVRDKEIAYERERFAAEIEREHRSKVRSKNMIYEMKVNRKGPPGSNKLNAFNLSTRNGKKQLFRITGKNYPVLRLKKLRKQTVQRLRVECEQSLRKHYRDLAEEWAGHSDTVDFPASPFCKMLLSEDLTALAEQHLANLEHSFFLIFKNIFVFNLLHNFHVRLPSPAPFKAQLGSPIPRRHTLSTVKTHLTSRLSGWPFVVNLGGVKSTNTLGSNVIQNLVQEYARPEKVERSIFSKLIGLVENLITHKKTVKQEINVDGKDVQDMLEAVHGRWRALNAVLRPMKVSFPQQLALTDIFYNQIGLGLYETAPYFLHVQHELQQGVVSRAVEVEVFYRLESEFNRAANNQGNRFLLEMTKKNLWGLDAKKCGRKGCLQDLSRKVDVRELTLQEIRKRLKVANEGNTSVPAGFGEVDETQLDRIVDEYALSDRDTGIFRGLDGVENMKGSDLTQVDVAENAILQTNPKHIHVPKDFFLTHYLGNRKEKPAFKNFDNAETLGKCYKRLPDSGLILVKNPGLPSPDIYLLEIVILEKFTGNRSESWNLLLQDKVLLNRIKFGRTKRLFYQTESEASITLDIALHLGNVLGRKKVAKVLAQHQERLALDQEGTCKKQMLKSTSFDLMDEMKKMGVLAEETGNPTQGNPLGPGGSERKQLGKEKEKTDSDQKKKARERKRSSMISVEMTGGGNSKGISRVGVLDSKAGSHIITKNVSRVEHSQIIDLNSSNESSVFSWESDSGRELDNMLNDLNRKLNREPVEGQVGEKKFDFSNFKVQQRDAKLLTKSQQRKLQAEILRRLLLKASTNKEQAKGLNKLVASTKAVLESNMRAYSYLLGVFCTSTDESYHRVSFAHRNHPVSKLQPRAPGAKMIPFKKSGVELTKKTWLKLATVVLGPETMDFSMNNFVFGSQLDDRVRRRDFLKQQYYPPSSYVLKKKLVTPAAIFANMRSISVLQVMQLISRNEGAFLAFLLDYFHWLDLTHAGQSSFVNQEHLIELLYVLFFLNDVPVTREFLGLNLRSLLGLNSQQSKDIYEYYSRIQPIKSTASPKARRQKLLRWIRASEAAQAKKEYTKGKALTPAFNQSATFTTFESKSATFASAAFKSRSLNRSSSIGQQTFSSARRRSSSLGSTYSTGSSQTASLISLSNVRRRQRNNKKFKCFYCNEEIRAKKTNDGLHRKIYRPESEGFLGGVQSAAQVVSAFVVTSKQPAVEVQPVLFHARDSINMPSMLSQQRESAFLTRAKLESGHLSAMNPNFNSETLPSAFKKDHLHKLVNHSYHTRPEGTPLKPIRENLYEVVDISSEVCDLIEQASLFLGAQELPFTDDKGTLVVLQEIFARRNRPFGAFNKLVIIDNRLSGKVMVTKFGPKGNAGEIVKFALGDTRVAFPREFLTHLLYSNPFFKSLFAHSLN